MWLTEAEAEDLITAAAKAELTMSSEMRRRAFGSDAGTKVRRPNRQPSPNAA